MRWRREFITLVGAAADRADVVAAPGGARPAGFLVENVSGGKWYE
ncbi:MAG TPA: hypothetical protein VGU20_10970 [Stellaceae bacterium]|nr:hypothetical protein [Stellaceae bacterium]